MSVLREGLLRERAVALAGGVPEEVRSALSAFGARVEVLDLGCGERLGGEWAQRHAPLNGLVYDSASAFGEGGAAGLTRALEQAWLAIREVGGGALIPGGRGGKLVLIGPGNPEAHLREAADAALENVARTLSVEWARYDVTTTMLAPAPASTRQVLAELVCFLLSAGGEYFSGCRLSLERFRG